FAFFQLLTHFCVLFFRAGAEQRPTSCQKLAFALLSRKLTVFPLAQNFATIGGEATSIIPVSSSTEE
ncbi:MAG: hypothetical protein KJZ86_18275, partial [Caldilineaceae bacterium]|nr:hypothetical protein [Caldilineaceae bacterium]HRJ40546.1 hypothetical protein [Caldilineaceae bacterium]